MKPKLYLAASARTRFATGMMTYFAQGIPDGLLGIAIPTWLAAQGTDAGDIGTYLAIIYLPWAFKLVSGPLMDRYQFPAMGGRRPWVLAAQLGLTTSLLALSLIDDPVNQIGLLTACGILVNIFAATQDVAVDSMSIELVPAPEQGRLNAFMSFGKAIGWAVSAAASGVMLTTWGLGIAAIAATACSALIFFACLLVREREGDRLLPWSKGTPSHVNATRTSYNDLIKGLRNVLWSRISLVVISIMFLDGLAGGYGSALTPIAAINLFGFTTPQWSNLVAVMGLLGAVVALGLGPLIDHFGAKRMQVFIILVVIAHTFLLAGTQHYWQDTLYVQVMMSIWVLLGPISMVCIIALAMAVCSPAISATQFALYMSIANLGASLGSELYGRVADETTFVQSFVFMGFMGLVTLTAVLFYRSDQEASVNGQTPDNTSLISPIEYVE